jgi:hypothetical protein
MSTENDCEKDETKALSQIAVRRSFTDKVESWWNGLTYSQKRHYENKTFHQEWFEDNTLVYQDIETMYKKHVQNYH